MGFSEGTPFEPNNRPSVNNNKGSDAALRQTSSWKEDSRNTPADREARQAVKRIEYGLSSTDRLGQGAWS